MKKFSCCGILTWDGYERRSKRYGAFVLDKTNFNNDAHVKPSMDVRLGSLVGLRVKITARVIEARDSGHAGDQYIQLFPVTPAVGEVIEIGVGIIDFAPAAWGGNTQIILSPNDGRKKFWIDPKTLFRLHDQTVMVTIEETTEDFTPAVHYENRSDAEMIANGDGTMQTSIVDLSELEGAKVVPNFIDLDDGVFAIDNSVKRAAGEQVKIIRR